MGSIEIVAINSIDAQLLLHSPVICLVCQTPSEARSFCRLLIPLQFNFRCIIHQHCRPAPPELPLLIGIADAGFPCHATGLE